MHILIYNISAMPRETRHFWKKPINTRIKAGEIIHLLLIYIKNKLKKVLNCIVDKNTKRNMKNQGFWGFS